MQPTRRIAIIGGGISGLAAAYQVVTAHPEASFVLYEASNRLGGIVETVHERGFTIECGPDSWVTEKPWARELAEELGLGAQIIGSNDHQRRTWLAQGRSLTPMPDGMRMMVPGAWEPLLHSSLLSWQAKLAYLREPKRAAELKESALLRRGPYADESVAEFVIRHFGEEATRMLAGPLLAGVFGGDIYKLSVRAVMAPFVAMEEETGSLIAAVRARAGLSLQRPPIFTSLRSGLATLTNAIAARLPQSSVLCNTQVVTLSMSGQDESRPWRIVVRDGQAADFDSVLLATPVSTTRSLLSTLRDADGLAAQAAALLPLEASSSIVAALAFLPEKARGLRIPRGFGLLVRGPQSGSHREEQPSLLAATFVDQKFSHRVPPEGVLLRGFFGGVSADPMEQAADSDVIAETHRRLSRLLGPLPQPDVAVVRRWPLSLPQYAVGHLERMALLDGLVRQLPGLRLVGNACRGVGLPDLIRSARSTVTSEFSVLAAQAVP